MSQQLQLGKYEFYPSDRQLIAELLFEIRELRRELRQTKAADAATNEEIEEGYRQLAEAEAADPNYFDWIEN